MEFFPSSLGGVDDPLSAPVFCGIWIFCGDDLQYNYKVIEKNFGKFFMYTESRPWGTFEVLVDEEEYKVKRLQINPGQAISLQYHENRVEYWVVVAGRGTVTIEDVRGNAEQGNSFIIEKKVIHRVEASEEGITIIETQLGKCDEEDIVRLLDNYRRE